MRCTPTIGLLMISMATHAVDFRKDIQPLLKNKCSRCHSGHEAKGGVKPGHLFGKTADERPCKTIENPATITDLHSTIFQAMGIPPTYNVTVEQRPFYATKDGKGRPLHGVLA